MDNKRKDFERISRNTIAPVLALLISLLGEGNYLKLVQEPYFYANWLWNWGSIVVVMSLLIVCYRFRYRHLFFKYKWVQFTFYALLANVVIVVLAYIYIEWIWRQSIFDYPELFTYDLLNYFVWNYSYLLLLNFVHVRPSQKRTLDYHQKATSLLGRKGRHKLNIHPSQIAAIYLRHGNVYAHLWNGKEWLLEVSMTEVSSILPKSEFFIANRQSLFSKRFIAGYEKLPNRKIQLTLKRPIAAANTIISKAKAPMFKKWWSQGDIVRPFQVEIPPSSAIMD